MLDTAFLLIGFVLYRKYFFADGHSISSGFKEFFTHYKWTMIFAVWNLFFSCFSMWSYVIARN